MDSYVSRICLYVAGLNATLWHCCWRGKGRWTDGSILRIARFDRAWIRLHVVEHEHVGPGTPVREDKQVWADKAEFWH